MCLPHLTPLPREDRAELPLRPSPLRGAGREPLAQLLRSHCGTRRECFRRERGLLALGCALARRVVRAHPGGPPTLGSGLASSGHPPSVAPRSAVGLPVWGGGMCAVFFGLRAPPLSSRAAGHQKQRVWVTPVTRALPTKRDFLFCDEPSISHGF